MRKDLEDYIRHYDIEVWVFGGYWEGDLDLRGTKIKDLGNLFVVNGDLDVRDTPLADMYTENEINNMVIINSLLTPLRVNIKTFSFSH